MQRLGVVKVAMASPFCSVQPTDHAVSILLQPTVHDLCPVLQAPSRRWCRSASRTGRPGLAQPWASRSCSLQGMTMLTHWKIWRQLTSSAQHQRSLVRLQDTACPATVQSFET